MSFAINSCLNKATETDKFSTRQKVTAVMDGVAIVALVSTIALGILLTHPSTIAGYALITAAPGIPAALILAGDGWALRSHFQKQNSATKPSKSEEQNSDSVIVFEEGSKKKLNVSTEATERFSPNWKPLETAPDHFSQIHSGELLEGTIPTDRAGFLGSDDWTTSPPVISRSEFVPDNMVEHLMINKKDTAIWVKYVSGDQITNMEGALHTFVTPICSIHMVGDYCWKGGHNIEPFQQGSARPVVMSAAVQPDFEAVRPRSRCDKNVMLGVVSLTEKPCHGVDLRDDIAIPSAQEKTKAEVRAEYDEGLKKHMVYHLTASHQLPSKTEVKPMNSQEAINWVEGQIQAGESFDPSSIQDQFALIRGHIISLEALFNVYVHQLRNEFSALEALLPQGYIYTIDPAKIFAGQLGGAEVMNRLQILAFKYLAEENGFVHLKVLAFNDFADFPCIKLLRAAFKTQKDVEVVPKSSLFKGENGHYQVEHSEYALVLHNNSDGFGQNIEHEVSKGSMDAILGEFSDAAGVLKRERQDLLNQVF